MSAGPPRWRAALGTLSRVATLTTALMVAVSASTVVGGSRAEAAADEPPPTLEPARVGSSTQPFSLVPPPGARCEEDGLGRSGADGWRWHTFIVEAGRDLATLEFGPSGPGRDYDASDGQITAGLITSGDGVWSRPPAQQPPGLINPGELNGLVLDPADYTLRDGRYLLGFACTDAASVTKHWWSVEVVVQTAAAPFLAAAEGAEAPDDEAEGTTTTTPAAAVSDQPADPPADAVTVASPADDAPDASADPVNLVSTLEDDSIGAVTGVSWSPLVSIVDVSSVLPIGGWAALVVVFGRISYLLARPVRVLPQLAP